MNICFNRTEGIAYYAYLNHISEKDALTSYIDLMFYHTNIDILKNENNWRLWDNSLDDIVLPEKFKGYAAGDNQSQVAVFQDYHLPVMEETGVLLKESEQCLRDLLGYCIKNDIQLLLTSNPFIITEQQEKEVNRIKEIAAEYGISLLDTNNEENWSQMRLNAAEDFYNVNHVNVLGAGKYTAFLAEYLTDRYRLIDHRGETEYASWQKIYEDRYLPFIDSRRQYTRTIAGEYQQTFADEDMIRSSENAYEWLSLVQDENFCLLLAVSDLSCLDSSPSCFILKELGMSDEELESMNKTFISIYSGGVEYATTTSKDYSYSFSTAAGNDVKCTLTLQNGSLISVNGTEYRSSDAGIHIVVINKDTGKVVDFVNIKLLNPEEVTMSHFPLGK